MTRFSNGSHVPRQVYVYCAQPRAGSELILQFFCHFVGSVRVAVRTPDRRLQSVEQGTLDGHTNGQFS